jgi:hypothetical protein
MDGSAIGFGLASSGRCCYVRVRQFGSEMLLIVVCSDDDTRTRVRSLLNDGTVPGFTVFALDKAFFLGTQAWPPGLYPGLEERTSTSRSGLHRCARSNSRWWPVGPGGGEKSGARRLVSGSRIRLACPDLRAKQQAIVN